MSPMSPLSLIIQPAGSQLKRRFANDVTNSEQFKCLLNLLSPGSKWISALKEARAHSHPQHMDFDKEVESWRSGEAFTKAEDLSWHLELHLRNVLKSKTTITFVISGACGYHGGFSKGTPPTYRFFFRAEERSPKERIQRKRGFADTLLLLAPDIAVDDSPTDLLTWFALSVTVQYRRNLAGGSHECGVSAELFPRTGYTRYCIPLPGLKTETSSKVKERCKGLRNFLPLPGLKVEPGSKIKERYKGLRHFLVASQNVREAVRLLAEAWHNPTLKSVLLSAPPGSGKEELKNFLVDALDAPVVDFACPELAGSDAGRSIGRALKKSGLIETGNGKEQCKKAVLFFDEVHHSSAAPFRSHLLRIMEAKRVTVGDQELSLERAIFILAASKPPEFLATLDPPDLWTRIQHTIVQKHPLDLRMDERKATLGAYFDMFWRRTHDALDPPPHDGLERQHYNALGDPTMIAELAKAFVDAMDSPLVTLFSIRTIRSVVERLYTHCRHHLQINLVSGGTDSVLTELNPKDEDGTNRGIGFWCTMISSTVIRDKGLII